MSDRPRQMSLYCLRNIESNQGNIHKQSCEEDQHKNPTQMPLGYLKQQHELSYSYLNLDRLFL